MPKSAERCGIVTPPNQHESGTFRPPRGAKAPRVTGITPNRWLKSAARPKTVPSGRLHRRRFFLALVDHLVDNSEIAGHLGGEEFVAFQRVLDRLEGLAGVFDVDLVEPLLEVKDFLRMQHD